MGNGATALGLAAAVGFSTICILHTYHSFYVAPRGVFLISPGVASFEPVVCSRDISSACHVRALTLWFLTILLVT